MAAPVVAEPGTPSSTPAWTTEGFVSVPLDVPPALCELATDALFSFEVGADADSPPFATVNRAMHSNATFTVVVPEDVMRTGLWLKAESSTMSVHGALPRDDVRELLRFKHPRLFAGLLALTRNTPASISGRDGQRLVVEAPSLNAFTPARPLVDSVGCSELTPNDVDYVAFDALVSPLAGRAVAFANNISIPVRAMQGGPVLGTLNISDATDHEAYLLQEASPDIRIAFRDRSGSTLVGWIPESAGRRLQRDPQTTQVGDGSRGGVTSRRGVDHTEVCAHELPLFAVVGERVLRVGAIRPNVSVWQFSVLEPDLRDVAPAEDSLISADTHLYAPRCPATP